ncbi:MAG: DUF2262 domain-containing protein [Ruminococcus sp.]|nr:DUF2262 domain-containing protein [Ruminococcus sp.]
MSIRDFSRGNDEKAAFTAKADVWGDEANLFVMLDNDTPRGSHTVEKIYPLVDKIAQKLDLRRRKIEDALLADGWLETAEDWASQCRVSKNDPNCYIMDNGDKVYLPLTEDDFCSGLYIESVCIYFDEELDINDVTIFIVCQPDYFAGRAIAVLLDSDGGIQIKGLEE